MATKTTPAASKAEATARPLTDEEREGLLADSYLSDLVYDALLERGEASKVSELAQEINNASIGFAVVRSALDNDAKLPHSRFVLMARLWNLKARYMDVTRSLERNLMDVIRAAGKPLSTAQLATELSVIYNRPSETYFGLLGKVLSNTNLYFKGPGSSYGLAEWLPLVDGEDLTEVALDNKLKPESLKPYQALNAKVGWSASTYAEASYKIVAALKGRPVSHRLLGVLAWSVMGEKYDPRVHLSACLTESRLIWLSAEKGRGRWITREAGEKLERLLADRASHLADEAEEVAPAVVVPEPSESVEPTVSATTEENPVVAEIVAEPLVPSLPAEPEVKPLVVSEEDLVALASVVSERGAPVEVAELLALQYEVVPGDPSFKGDVAVLEARLKGDSRFLYVGAGRFREAETLPPFVYDVPEFLAFPELQFVSMDGEIMDEEIEDEGFAGSLRQDILHPLAQDAGDDEGFNPAPVPEEGVRLVLKAHHKEIGTFPLCQVPAGFFPEDAPLVEVTLREEDGTAHELFVNNEHRLAFNLFSLYEKIEADSGGCFLLQTTARPYEFRVEVLEENDPQLYLSPERYADLLGAREQAEESGDVATFDIVCELLEEYPKGLDFLQLLTEVNVVRRVTRRKLASILSNYFCFMQKAGTGQWRFDSKKRDLGTDRTKRKYLKR